ncbi:MAG: hypothetical protein HGA79_05475 [Anaerolineales bacterium]|nr:hypothetical protein [Anaerolineales bacterium]
MITQTSHPQTTFPMAGSEIPPRIIVLVPDAEINLAHAAKRIWEIAAAAQAGVQFIGLCADSSREPRLRRQMVTLSALVEAENIAVRSRIEIGNDWLYALRTEWRQGELIVCFAGAPSGFSRKPLIQLLESSVRTTIYVIDGLLPQAQPSRSEWWSNVLAWAGSLVIILGLFWLQTKITQIPTTDWARTLLFCISIFIELGMIWMWNSLFSQRPR